MSRAASLEQGEESSNNHRSRKPSWEKKYRFSRWAGKEADEGILFSKVGPRKKKDHSQADAAISEKSKYGRARRVMSALKGVIRKTIR